MKKTLFVILLALTLCLSACAKETATNDNLNTAPPATVETETETPADIAQPEQDAPTAEQTTPAPEVSPSASAPSEESTEAPADSTPAPETDTPADEQPAATDEAQPQPDESAASGAEATPEDILVEFDGELTVCSEPFRIYSHMWTVTMEDYHTIASDATFTVTNDSEDESSYITVTIVEYIRSAESFISVVNHGGTYLEADMLGQFWGSDEGLWLSDQIPSDFSAGDGLYWSTNEDYDNYSQVVKLYPGQSVTFQLPEREQDTITRLNVQYRKEGEEFPLFGRSFYVSADDVSVPVITAE